MNTPNIQIISAGAGSGKTYRLVQELTQLLDPANPGHIRPDSVIATTFTKKNAAELIERIRGNLLEKGWTDIANQLETSFIGTVHSVCEQLLKQFAFEAGLSPKLEVIPKEEQNLLFQQALSALIDERLEQLSQISYRFHDELDWPCVVRTIAEAARTNNLKQEDLLACAQRSLEALMRFYPESSNETPEAMDQQLLSIIEQALEDTQQVGDSTKTTAEYLTFLEIIANSLKQNRPVRWSEWVKLTKAEPAKRSIASSNSVRQYTLKHREHPRLHADLKLWITLVFDLAAESLTHYQEFKQKRGLIDFGDQEVLLLNLLEHPEVQKQLQEEIAVLIVDEFQDTNPIQLAIFLKLSHLVKRSIWVGDPKQSIYAFRGADPALMASVVQAIGIQKDDILGTSYRSRKALVDFTNALFIPAFLKLKLPIEQIQLSSDRTLDASELQPALQHWKIEAKNKAQMTAAMANGIFNLLKEPCHVWDKNEQKIRPIRPNDIAILCRTHEDCAEMARALTAMRLPVALAQEGLILTPEAKLVLAALRKLLDTNDTLATAEILILTEHDLQPETWLEDRLNYLQTQQPSSSWKSDHTVIAAIERLRPLLNEFSPSEALDHLIEKLDLRRMIAGWENPEQRFSNLEVLRRMAGEYEKSCERMGSASTVSGMLLWLRNLEKGGNQGMETQKDAIDVLTYHTAKGLEWPVVVVWGLEKDLKTRLWSVEIIDERLENKQPIDLEQPLANRWIRYWPWPYGKQKKETGLQEQVEQSPIYDKAFFAAQTEELQLLYVGMTRARDYLILPIRKTPTQWLDLVLEMGNHQLNFPTSPGMSQLTLNASKLELFTLEPKEADSVLDPLPIVTWVKARKGRQYAPQTPVAPSSLVPDDASPVKLGATIAVRHRVAITGNPEMDQLGNALHAFLAADHQTSTPEKRQRMLVGLLERFGVKGSVLVEDVIHYVDEFYKLIETRFHPIKMLRECPLQMKWENQILKGTADLLLETTDGWVVIDHKSYPGKRNHWAEEAIKYSGQLKAYAEAVNAATQKQVIATYLHFALGGGLVEVQFS
ncbi:UvrD-helicase domain-containing protein [Deltaproteobacteria bacterium TL4]